MRLLAWLATALLLAGGARAQIATDGSLNQPAGARELAGPQFQVRPDDGRLQGSGLFFSFRDFGVPRGGSVTFLGDPQLPSLDVVAARVTGGSPSLVDGPFRSELGERHFFFLNPAGVIFGPDSSLDVPGSFHLSTADELIDAGGNVFSASEPSASVLQAAPEAFGFLDGSAGRVEIQGRMIVGAARSLALETGEVLDVVGGDVRVSGARSLLWAPSGTLRLASVRGPARVEGVSGRGALRLGDAARGAIEVSDDAVVSVSGLEPEIAPAPVLDPTAGFDFALTNAPAEGEVELARDPALGLVLVFRPHGPDTGDLFVQADSLVVRDAALQARSFGRAGGRIDVELSGALRLEKTRPGPDTGILARSEATGVFYASQGRIQVLGFDELAPPDLSQPTEVAGEGSGTAIAIEARDVSLDGGARASATTFTRGSGGSIEIEAGGDVSIRGRDTNRQQTATAVFSNSQGSGDAGGITLRAESLRLEQGGALIAQTTGDADAGDIRVEVATLEILDDSQIDSSTSGQAGGARAARGDGGRIDVVASERVLLAGRLDADRFARISTLSQEGSAGRAGRITVATPLLQIEDGAGISVRTRGSGAGGDIVLDVGRLSLRRGASISARSEAPQDAGDAGDIIIGPEGAAFPNRVVEVFGGSSINAEAQAAGGGNISVNAPAPAGSPRGAAPRPGFLVHLANGEIATSVSRGEGSGGNVTLASKYVVLNASDVLARADAGAGGNIDIQNSFPLVASADSQIDASSNTGIDGQVSVRSPTEVLVDELAPLPQRFLDASKLMRDHCAASAGDVAGSLVVSPVAGIGAAPDGYLLASVAGSAMPPSEDASRLPPGAGPGSAR